MVLGLLFPKFPVEIKDSMPFPRIGLGPFTFFLNNFCWLFSRGVLPYINEHMNPPSPETVVGNQKTSQEK